MARWYFRMPPALLGRNYTWLTDWEETIHYLGPLAGVAKSNIHTNIKCDFGDCNTVTWLYYSPPDFQVEGGIYIGLPENKVHFISVDTSKKPLPNGMAIRDILNTYGLPSMILMNVNPYNTFEGGVNGATLLLLLDYPKNNFLIVYHRQAEQLSGSFVSCVDEDTSKLMIFEDGKSLETFETLTIYQKSHN